MFFFLGAIAFERIQHGLYARLGWLDCAGDDLCLGAMLRVL